MLLDIPVPVSETDEEEAAGWMEGLSFINCYLIKFLKKKATSTLSLR
jgi:hypothetical protein